MLDVFPSYQLAGRTSAQDSASSVFALMRPDNDLWRWNAAAIAEIALFGHTTGTNTLCEGIIRKPAPGQRQLEWNVDDTIDGALERLVAAFRECVDGAPAVHLSLSAGYDSRLLLALCLSAGIRPELSVMGYVDSTDVIVASAIAAKIGLPIRRIELQQDDYLTHGAQIAADTSGVKAAFHWHTWLYAKALDAKDGVHLVGNNGEFARSLYVDRKAINPVVDTAPASFATGYWALRLARRKLRFSRHNPLLHGPAANPLRRASAGMGNLQWGPRNCAEALDCFYTEQRVRHLMGAGLACYARFGKPTSPFFDDDWIKAVARLKRPLKRGSYFHVESIRRLAPALDGFPHNRLPNGQDGRDYHPFAELCMTPQVTEMLAESEYLDAFATRADRIKILSDDACEQIEERSLWMMLHYAAQPAVASA